MFQRKFHCAICKTQSCFTFLIFPYAKDERSIEKGGELKKEQLWLWSKTWNVYSNRKFPKIQKPFEEWKERERKNPILSLPLCIIRTGSSTYLNKLVSYFDIEILFNFDGKVTAFLSEKIFSLVLFKKTWSLKQEFTKWIRKNELNWQEWFQRVHKNRQKTNWH